jgi:SulP family sulfate permease
MAISFQHEVSSIVGELKRRLHTATIDTTAPRQLFRRECIKYWRHDIVGGLTVSIMDIPQALAYAIIAGVPPIMGLYCAVFVGMVSGFWSHSTYLTCGPTNAASLMLAAVLATQFSGNVVAQVALITFVIGAFQVVAAALSVGGLTKFISRSVIVGYATGAGALIFLGQLPNLIGIQVAYGSLLSRVWQSLAQLQAADMGTMATAATSLLAMIVVRRYGPRMPVGILGLVAGTLYAWGIRETWGDSTVRLVADIQHIPNGLPRLIWPGFNLNNIYTMVGPAIALGLLACIEVATISKSLGMRTGTTTRPNQDIFGLGLGNLVGSFFGAIPGSGSFTRSELSYRSGMKTRWGVIFTSLISLLVLATAGQAIELIPIASLAALICWLALGLIDLKRVRVALTATHSDAVVFLVTFFATMFTRLDSAIYLGMLVSMGLFLQKASVPKLMEFQFDDEGRFRPAKESEPSATPQISIVHVEGELFFGAAESIQDEILRTVEPGLTKVIILRLRNAQHLDATGVMVLEQLIRDLRQQGIQVLISGTSHDIDRVVGRSGLDKSIGKENYFPSGENFLDATRRAMQRAKELVGADDAQIKLFYDKDKEAERAANTR